MRIKELCLLVALVLTLVAALLLDVAEALAQEPLPAWQLHESRDSMVINAGGAVRGFSVFAVERNAGGYRVTERTMINGMVDQSTELLVGADQRVTQVKQTGTSRGMPTSIDLRYTASHVKGTATVPGQPIENGNTIDTALPPNVIDDNYLHAVLAGLPWKAGASWIVPLFSSRRNGVTDMKLSVVGEETVNTARGPVEAWKTEMRGDVVAVNFWISKAAPQRLVKIQPIGAPMEMILAN